MNTAIRFLLVLGIICVVMGGGVALLYGVFQKPIAEKQVEQYNAMLKELFPDLAETRTIAGADTPDDLADDVNQVFGAQGQLLGYTAQGHRQGYSSDVKVLVGFAPDGQTIRKVAILDQQETPGLGTNAAQTRSQWNLWHKLGTLFGGSDEAEPMENAFLDQFANRTPAQFGEVDAITAATITSDAVKAGVRMAADRVSRALAQKPPSNPAQKEPPSPQPSVPQSEPQSPQPNQQKE
jgi:electron transport complex protein RnfG